MWNDIWNIYVKDWMDHSLNDHIIQVITILFILIIGMIAIRILGKKSLSQTTLIDVLFIFVLSATLGALITKPERIFVALLVVITIVSFVLLLQKLQLKITWFEKMMISLPDIIYEHDGFNIDAMKRNSLTVDVVEMAIRQRGYPSIEVCKKICFEPTGNLSFELKPEYEPIKKIYFDDAMNQILKAIKDQNYKEVKLPKMNNVFNEVGGGNEGNQKPIPKELD